MTLNYKNYIFDFGQVIVRFEPEYLTAKYIHSSDDKELTQKIVFDRLYWDKLDEGKTNDAEVRRCICSRLPERLHRSALAVYDNWYRNLEFIRGIPELLREIKAEGGRLYLLSNIGKTFGESYGSIPHIKEIFSLFDGLVFSAPLGLVKPDKKIFEHLLNKYSLNAEECIFIDDNENNISAANKIGFNTFLFKGDVEELKKQL